MVYDVDGNVIASMQDSDYWHGKKVVWTGDSISYGSWLTNPQKDAYPYLVANKLGVTVANYAIGGSAIAKQADSYEACFVNYADWTAAISAGTLDTTKKYLVRDNNSVAHPYGMYRYSNGAWSSLGNDSETCKLYPIVDRVYEMDTDADVVVIAAATNDFYHDDGFTPIGTMDSRDKNTFYGALHQICYYLVQTFINKQIFFVTPIKRYQTTPWSCTQPYSKNSLGKSLKDYSDIIKEVCAYYSIPVIDMFSLSGMNPTMEWSLFADTDGKHVHPNAAGHRRMASVATPIIQNSRA